MNEGLHHRAFWISDFTIEPKKSVTFYSNVTQDYMIGCQYKPTYVVVTYVGLYWQPIRGSRRKCLIKRVVRVLRYVQIAMV